MAKKLSLLAMCALALALAGCTNKLSGLEMLPPATISSYELAPGDELRVLIPELSDAEPQGMAYTINESGMLSLPVLGDIDASGRTVPQLQEEVAVRLRDAQILRNPTVSIQPVSLRPVYVMGEVQRPGEYPFRPGMSVLAAVAAAGGYTFRAQDERVRVTRTIDGRSVTGIARETDMIQPGDAIMVAERFL
ncbi:polysaccharide biosynthesis/export family protein [Aurantiacibacter spongiae]|uniref:Polysaccharide export protein n=1 Tax=Aurantiacibacter spongiae TaxID=2488860 RepID=A0A3N5D990_9SPHN|nr:polysaccharide biosynthesis/export family protein [Aurantiacibacter spongiae]RPF71168.1 polysaccharide export protein [Aurantiacibacter spongiae]